MSGTSLSAYQAAGPVARPLHLVPLPAVADSMTTAVPTAEQLIRAQSKRSRVLKRSGDIVFSLAVLALGSPLLLLLAVLVKLSSPGPVFYVQRRIGRGYKGFGCIKFRTMRKDADRILKTLLEQSPELKAEFKKTSSSRPTHASPQSGASCAAPVSMSCPSSSMCSGAR